MNKINNCGLEFPMQDPQTIHEVSIAAVEGIPAYIQSRAEAVVGMSLRDYFAAAALPAVYAEFFRGVIAGEHAFSNVWRDDIAHGAYALADAMLADRAKGGAA
jgi:hypothetical protein